MIEYLAMNQDICRTIFSTGIVLCIVPCVSENHGLKTFIIGVLLLLIASSLPSPEYYCFATENPNSVFCQYLRDN